MRSRSLIIVGIVCSISLGGSHALAQDPKPEPSETTETFGSWTVRCRKAAEQPKNCEIVHAIQGQQGVVAQIAIGTPPGGNEHMIVVQTPLGVLVSQPVELVGGQEEDAPRFELPFQTCLQAGCIAQTDTAIEALANFAAAESADLTFNERNGRTIRISVPLGGMKSALSRLGDS